MQEQRALKLRKTNQFQRNNSIICTQDMSNYYSGTLTPNVYQYAEPRTPQMNSFADCKVSKEMIHQNFNMLRQQQLQQAQMKAAQSEGPGKSRKIPLNKYGIFGALTKAFPTPLGKFVERAADQKQKLIEFERNVI